jgi:hypothetical protein
MNREINKFIKEITDLDTKIETIEVNRLGMRTIDTKIDVLPKDMKVKERILEIKEETKGEIIDRTIDIRIGRIEAKDMKDLREPKDHKDSKDHKGSKELLDLKDIIQEVHKIKAMKEEIININKEEIDQVSKIEEDKEEIIGKLDKMNPKIIPESEDSANKKNLNTIPESDNLKLTIPKPKEILINSILN